MKNLKAKATTTLDSPGEEVDWRIERAELLLRRAELARQVAELNAEVENLQGVVAGLSTTSAALRQENDWLQGTLSWKLTRPLRGATAFARRLRGGALPPGAWSRLRKWQGRADSRTGVERGSDEGTAESSNGSLREQHRRALEAIFKRYPDRPVVIHRPLIDWDVPLFQRPQHVAQALGRQGILYFYCTPNWLDKVSGFREMGEGCFVTDQFKLLLEHPRSKVVHIYSTDPHLGVMELVELQRSGSPLFYEYVDEIHPHVAGREIAETVLDRHELIRRDDRVLLVATADRLLSEVAAYRSKNFGLVTNGVDHAHFSGRRRNEAPPEALAPLLGKARPVVGYYGALAKWFDYGLVRALAAARPEYEFLLIGPRYDESLDSAGLDAHPNVTVFGPVEYAQLPRYAQFFDVATIPFLLNDVTESTSPIKLFEYMALGHPIVTTDMRECRKYESVLIGRDPDEFARQLDRALQLRSDAAYQALLARESAQNTWDAKGAEIAELLRAAFPEVCRPGRPGSSRAR